MKFSELFGNWLRMKKRRIKRQIDYYTKVKRYWSQRYVTEEGEIQSDSSPVPHDRYDVEVGSEYREFEITDKSVKLLLRKSIRETLKNRQTQIYFRQIVLLTNP